MQTIRFSITIELPDNIQASTPQVSVSADPPTDPVEDYWSELGPGSRKLYRQAASTETLNGPGYTLDELAQKLSVDHQTVLAYNRNALRTAKAWETRTGTPAPIKLVMLSYDVVDDATGAERGKFKLPPGIAEQVEDLPYP